MRRYWLDSYQRLGEQVKVEGESFHHIVHVCRRDLGDKFEILFGDGYAHFVELIELNKKFLLLKILETRKIPAIKEPHIVLVLSIPKPNVFSQVIEKAVELGVKELKAVTSDFSHFKSAAHPALKKPERWQKIITSACQQSGRGEKMDFAAVTSLEDALENFNRNANAMGLFAYEGESAMQWKKAVCDIKEKRPQSIYIFVGSEGGFSQREKDLFTKYGLYPTTMGEQVLRVETACVALISSLKYEFEV